MRTAELVKKPASLPSIPPATAAAEIKSILFHVGADDDAESRLQAALSIARAFSAHLHLLHVTPIEAYAVVDAYGTFVNTDLIATLESDAAQLKSRLERSLANEDVSWDYEEITGALMDRLVRRASLADLLVCGRDLGDRGFGGSALALLGDLLRLVRTPLLILGDDRREIDLFGPALVAWNGSVEAANAVRAAIPLLKLASGVRVITVEERSDNRFPSSAILEYLSRHGVHADLVERGRTRAEIERDILEQARMDGAGLLVAGAYSHSRIGEYLFGGVTRAFLEACPIPLLIAR